MKFHDKCDHLDHKLQDYKVGTLEMLMEEEHTVTLSAKQSSVQGNNYSCLLKLNLTEHSPA